MGTSVLNISYKDNDKKLIIPVLQKISEVYQNYSGKKRKKDLLKGIAFLKNEIEDLNQKSQNSMKYLQEFSLRNKLGNLDGIPAESLIGESSPISTETYLKNLKSNQRFY